MNSGEVNQHVETRSLAVNFPEIDFRVQGVPYSTVEQQDTTRRNTVKNVIRQIKTHPHREEFKKDLQQKKVFSRFSEKSQDMLSSMANVEIFEMCEISPKTQCPFCLTYNTKRIVYCGCGYCLESTNTRWQVNKERFDILSIPHYVIHKGSFRGRRCGTSDAQHLYHKANEALMKARKKQYWKDFKHPKNIAHPKQDTHGQTKYALTSTRSPLRIEAVAQHEKKELGSSISGN